MLLQRLIKYLIITVWLVAMGWLVRYEAFPHWFEDTIQGYRTLTRDLPAVRDSWMKVLLDGQHVGYSNSTIEMEEVDGQEDLIMRSQLFLHIHMGSRIEHLRLTSRVNVRNGQDLMSFNVGFQLSEYIGEVKAVRVENNDFDLEMRLIPFMGDARMQRRIQISDQAIISGPLLDAGLRNLRPGQELRMRAMDPFSVTGELQEILLRGEGPDTIQTSDGETHHLHRVSMRSGDIVVQAWLTDTGQTIRQETPFGLVLESATVHQAVQVPDQNAVRLSQLLASPNIPGIPGL